MKPRVLLTGAQGQVGRLVAALLKDSTELFAFGRAELDLTDAAAIRATVADYAPDFIINAAAYTAVDLAETEAFKADQINHVAVAVLAEAAAAANAVLLHISTDYVFDGNGKQPFTEADVPAPVSSYGRSKLAGEQAAMALWHKVIVLRTAWVFAEQGQNFVRTILRFAREKSELSVVNDQIGGPTHAGDIASALVKMMWHIHQHSFDQWGVYHFSGMPYVSWFEFTDAILTAARQHGYIGPLAELKAVTSEAFVRPAKRPANSRLDCHKIQQVFGIEPSDWRSKLENINEYL
jgi:dTDP-4-dehydrorhamnose reductase